MVGNCIETVFASYIAACTKLSGVMVQIGLKVATDSRVTAAGTLLCGTQLFGH